jgi:fatty acid-binding protein DegV
MRFTIVLDTLESLRRGGRADEFITVVDRMTRALDIKPVINFVKGELRLMGAARSFQGGVKRVLNVAERLGALEQLAVVHTRRQEIAEEVAGQLAASIGFPRERILVGETGSVLVSHAGAGGSSTGKRALIFHQFLFLPCEKGHATM